MKKITFVLVTSLTLFRTQESYGDDSHGVAASRDTRHEWVVPAARQKPISPEDIKEISEVLSKDPNRPEIKEMREDLRKLHATIAREQGKQGIDFIRSLINLTKAYLDEKVTRKAYTAALQEQLLTNGGTYTIAPMTKGELASQKKSLIREPVMFVAVLEALHEYSSLRAPSGSQEYWQIFLGSAEVLKTQGLFDPAFSVNIFTGELQFRSGLKSIKIR